VPFNPEDYIHRIGRTGRAGAEGLAITLVSPGDGRLVADLERLLKKKLEIEPVEWDDERPRGRINDGRRAWREAGEVGDPRDVLDAPREAAREPREFRDRRQSSQPRDPFFDQPYEAPQREAAPSWESSKPAQPTSRVSSNIKTKRKVAALFKSAAPETTATS